MVPMIPYHNGTDDVYQTQMVEDIQETNSNANSLMEEEVKLVKYLNLRFYTDFQPEVISSPRVYFLHDESLYQFWYFKEMEQPPNC